MTYYEWVCYLDKLKTAPISDEPINYLNSSNIDYEGDIKIRFLNHIVDVTKYRLNTSLDSFFFRCRSFINDKDKLLAELNKLKSEVVFAKKLANIKYFDDNVKNELQTNIASFAEQMNEAVKNLFTGSQNNDILIIIHNLDFNA